MSFDLSYLKRSSMWMFEDDFSNIWLLKAELSICWKVIKRNKYAVYLVSYIYNLIENTIHATTMQNGKRYGIFKKKYPWQNLRLRKFKSHI